MAYFRLKIALEIYFSLIFIAKLFAEVILQQIPFNRDTWNRSKVAKLLYYTISLIWTTNSGLWSHEFALNIDVWLNGQPA